MNQHNTHSHNGNTNEPVPTSTLVSTLTILVFSTVGWIFLVSLAVVTDNGIAVTLQHRVSKTTGAISAAEAMTGPNLFRQSQQSFHDKLATTAHNEGAGEGEEESTEKQKVKVFGVGLSETGTLTMAKALTMLGFLSLHGDDTVATFMHHHHDHDNEADDDFVAADLSGRYDDVDSVWDVPTAGYYKELYKAYPDAKFILTIREDVDSWYGAMRRAVYSTKWGCNIPVRVQRLHRHLLYGSPFPVRSVWTRAYDQHNKDVKSFFAEHAPHQLLVLDYATMFGKNDGPVNSAEEQEREEDQWLNLLQNAAIWTKLCPFLGITDRGPCSRAETHSRPLLLRSGIKHPEWDGRDAALLDEGSIAACEESVDESGQQRDDVQAPPGRKEFAYVMLICDAADEDQIGYFRMLLVLKESIRQFEHQDIDIVVLVYGSIRDDQMQVLEYEGFLVKKVDTVGVAVSDPVNPDVSAKRSSCYRSKLRVLELIEYEKIIFLDTDLIVTRSQRNLLQYLGANVSFVGYDGPGSPFCAGLFALTPSMQSFADVSDFMESDAFHPSDGWLEFGPIVDWLDNRKMHDWSFYGAPWDQGTLYYYYDKVRNEALLLSHKEEGQGMRHYGGQDAKPYIYDPNNITTQNEVLVKGVKKWYPLWDRVEVRLMAAVTDGHDSFVAWMQNYSFY